MVGDVHVLNQVVAVRVVHKPLEQIAEAINTKEPNKRSWDQTDIRITGMDTKGAKSNHGNTDKSFGDKVVSIVMLSIWLSIAICQLDLGVHGCCLPSYFD